MICWTGRNTSGTCKWSTTGTTYENIYDQLTSGYGRLGSVISVVDYMPHEKYMIEEIGGDIYEFMNYVSELEENGIIDDYCEYIELLETKNILRYPDDNEFKIIIEMENGNAYYQNFEEI